MYCALICRSGMRTINLYNIDTCSPLSEIATSVTPATLIPYFDTDTKLLFLTGKVDGVGTVLSFISPLFCVGG